MGWRTSLVVSVALAGCVVDPQDGSGEDEAGHLVETSQQLVTGVPGTGAHNVLFQAAFTKGIERCDFVFMYGNFGVGYTQLRLDSAGCGLGRTSLVSGNFQQSGQATAFPGEGVVQATGVGNIIFAQYCVETHSTGALAFTYNALDNRLISQGEQLTCP
jgi:hypothetical protein